MMNNKVLRFMTAATIVGLIGLVYWPVHLASFVWDDQVCLHIAATLRHGDGWKRYFPSNFCGWHNYFRPLVVAMFATELRIFDVAPGPMHLVSLGFHLMNTVLVGLFTRTLSSESDTPNKSTIFAGIAMLLYGLHPALIEPVVWISCRFEIAQTFFMLLALLANAKIERVAFRALTVAVCFLLAAGAKESAAVLPLLLLLFDWIKADSPQKKPNHMEQLAALWKRQWPVYAAVLGAGFFYLALRFAALGFLVDTSNTPSAALSQRLQTVAFTLLTYWRLLVWPMSDLAPTHLVDPKQFSIFSAANVGVDLAVLAILLAGIYGTFKRNPIGYAILAFTIALLPVLHILPVAFDPSLYHERYIMLGLALTLSLLPRIYSAISLPPANLHRITIVVFSVGILWLGIAVLNIRITLPLWSDEIKLWQWQVAQDPRGAHYAKVNLLALYIDRNDRADAHKLADEFLAEKERCLVCMLNVAGLAMSEGDLEVAKTAMTRAKDAIAPTTDTTIWQSFILNTARMRELEHDDVEAAEDYRNAIAMDPLDPKAHMGFALFLARQGKVTQARAAMDETLPLWSSDVREQHRERFERTLSASIKSAQHSQMQRQP